MRPQTRAPGLQVDVPKTANRGLAQAQTCVPDTVAKAVTPPEPGMLPMPFYQTYATPGPAPLVPFYSSPRFNLTMPNGSDPNVKSWSWESQTCKWRAPQNRHVFGPFYALPSTILLKGIIDIGGTAANRATQGALFLHQQFDYNGGPEFGWVYYCTDRKLSAYFITDANIPSQLWKSYGTGTQAYIGQNLLYRLDLNATSRRFAAKIYSSNATLWNSQDTWPSWFRYDDSLPWYLTITWLQQENLTAVPRTAPYGSVREASLWYKP